MSNQNVISRFKDVKELALKTLGKCVCVRLNEPHAKGFMGVKLIVGYKINPIFDPNANPNRPDLKPAERTLEMQRANPRTADVRIIWLRPGLTVQELIEEHLKPIKKSLDKSLPVTTLEEKKQEKPKKTDDELAQMLEKGVNTEDEEDDGDDDSDYEAPEFEEDEEESASKTVDSEDDEFIEDEDGDIVDKKEKGPKSELSEVIEAIGTLAQNLQVVHDDVRSLSNRVSLVEKAKSSKKAKSRK